MNSHTAFNCHNDLNGLLGIGIQVQYADNKVLINNRSCVIYEYIIVLSFIPSVFSKSINHT